MVAVGLSQWSLGTRTAPTPTPQCAPPNSCTLRCSAKPLHPRAVLIGACHRARPFHTKHPVGKTHNFYTTQSRWSRRPFEVLFVGHLQAFLITGSLRGASLSPGFCLLVLGREGVSLGLHSAWKAPCQSPVLGLAWEGWIQAWDSVPWASLWPWASSSPWATLCARASSSDIS